MRLVKRERGDGLSKCGMGRGLLPCQAQPRWDQRPWSGRITLGPSEKEQQLRDTDLPDRCEDISAAPWLVAGDIWTLRFLPKNRVPIIAGQYAALFVDKQPISVPRNLQAETAQPDRKSRFYLPAERDFDVAKETMLLTSGIRWD